MMRNAIVPARRLSSTSPPSAKRFPPPAVAPLVMDGLTFEVPQDDGARAYIQARDTHTGSLLWSQTIFRAPHNPDLESDFQDLFIREMRVDGTLLVITDEQGRQYTLDPDNRVVSEAPKP